MKRYEAMTPRLALELANPQSWVASLYPAVFGELYCLWKGCPPDVKTAAALILICVLMQASVNTLNDFFDHIRGNDSREDCLEENDAVLLYHDLNPWHTLTLGFGFLALAGVLGLWIVWQAGLAPLAVGMAGAVTVVLYSAGPFPLSHYPVGELVSGLVMGALIPLGVAAAVTGTIRRDILFPSLPFVLGIGLIMMTNNISDVEKDAEAGRRTLPILLGRERARRLYRALAVGWLLLLLGMSFGLFGRYGFVAAAVLAVLGRGPYRSLMGAPLDQRNRIRQMKTVVAANLVGNGAYLAALLAAALGGR